MDKTNGGKKGMSKHIKVEEKVYEKNQASIPIRPICVGIILGGISPVFIFILLWISGVYGTPSGKAFEWVLKPINILWEGAKDFLVDLGLMHRESIVAAIALYICVLFVSGALVGGLTGCLVAIIKKVRASK